MDFDEWVLVKWVMICFRLDNGFGLYQIFLILYYNPNSELRFEYMISCVGRKKRRDCHVGLHPAGLNTDNV